MLKEEIMAEQSSLEIMLASAFVEDTGTKDRSMFMSFASGTVLGLWEHKVG